MLYDKRGQAFTVLIVLMIAMIAILIFVNWYPTRPQEKITILEVRFGETEILAGGQTDLTVTIKNMSDESQASNVIVEITPLDPSIVKVDKSQIGIGILGPTEERSPKVLIYVVSEAIKGTYTIKVSTSVDFPLEGDTQNGILTVK